MNILDLNHDIISKIENIFIERDRQKRKQHLDEIRKYERSATFFGHVNDGYYDPYEHYIYDGHHYETWLDDRPFMNRCKIVVRGRINKYDYIIVSVSDESSEDEVELPDGQNWHLDFGP